MLTGAWDRDAFEAAARSVIAGLQPGELVTYGEVAMEAGWPGHARAVGALLRERSGGLPWWRVVPASGRLAPHLVREQSRRLRAEGVTVVDGRIRGSRR
ncbi:MAG TPA: MGMT family protein [Acidimicrobiales bacterium]|jgi:alkylated DNA nucleotide flippase Atl1|nr:MGMT family protein [Acidimicrobiales bacterium]